MGKPAETKFHTIRVPNKRFAKGYMETGVYTDGVNLRLGNSPKGYPIDKHPKWDKMTKGQRRAIRRAAYRAGFRGLAAGSVRSSAAQVNAAE